MKAVNLTAVALGLFVCLGASNAMAQGSDTAPSDIDAEIITALSVTNTAGLNFGQVVAGTTLGTVVLTPAGATSVTGGPTGPQLGSQTNVSQATFSVTGAPDATYDITLPTAPVTIGTGAPGITMTVSSFTSTPDGSGSLSGTTGTETLNVGATLAVGAAQQNGNYSGTFNVTVTYN